MIQLSLPNFLKVVRDYEENASEDRLFWECHSALTNYLTEPIRREQCTVLDHFLRDWRSQRVQIDWEQLEYLWTPEVQLMSSKCSPFRLESCDLNQVLDVSGHRIPLKETIRVLYGRLQQVHGVGATNASKLLAVAMPDLFMMWDEQNIRGVQSIPSTQSGYLRLMEEMRGYCDKLIDQISRNEGLTPNEAAKWLRRLPLCPNWNSYVPQCKPIAKLLDEYNYRLPKWLDKVGFFVTSIQKDAQK